MTLYNYVANTNEIKKEVMLKGFHALYKAVYEALDSSKRLHGKLSIEEDCRIIATEIFRFACRHRGVYDLIFNCNDPLLRGDPELAPYYWCFYRLLKRIGSEQPVKQYNRALQMLNHVIHGLISEKLHGISDYSLEEYLIYVDDFIAGMLKERREVKSDGARKKYHSV
jgi:hypothetical protein